LTLDLHPLLDLIKEIPVYREITDKLKKLTKEDTQVLVLDAAKPYLIAALYHELKLPMLVVTAQPDNAKKLFEQISLWCNSSELNIFPEPDTLPYQRTIADFSVEQERLQVLYSLSNPERKKMPPLIISSASALIQKTTPKSGFTRSCHIIETGSEIEQLALIRRWESMGYQIENMVEVPGIISHRGGIVDIFPPTSDSPVRMEFFGNTIESLRLFDPAIQRSMKVISRISICPATEMMLPENKTEVKTIFSRLDLSNCTQEVREQLEHEITMISEGQRPPNISFYAPLFNSGNLLDYLPDNAILILDESLQVKEEAEYLEDEAEELRAQKLESGELPANFPYPYFNWKETEDKLKNRTSISLASWVRSEDPNLFRLDFTIAPNYASQLPALISKSGEFLNQNKRLIFISNQASRLSELFEEEGLFAEPTDKVSQVPSSGSLTLLQGSLAEGWLMGNTYLLTDKEIFNFIKEGRLLKKRPVRRHKLLVDIKPGDYVVHIEHGIGQFSSIINMNTDSTQKEYLVLTYAAGDKLYVPTDQIDRISRYVGAGEDAPNLSRLGTQEWNRTKQKVKEAVEEIAQDLLQLYATREVVTGHSYSPDTVWQKELEASFPYIETSDQMKVQEEVKEDMAKSKPMDRLVIGDVGYGKTEIAIRAAFKAVMDNKQVAMLVPTTVLAEQHLITFKQRMGTFPVKIEVLSRFRTSKEQKRVLEGLANGSIDICIGTHRLLQKDVVFKDLGLLIIDEEQRFGVSHKEHLKKLREQVDVLTLSATPIPRTLHMSLVGVRDMSVIETPPENRLPIKTYIAEYNNHLIREAILRELERNGQVFFVHNRVQGIAAIAGKLKELMPEARIDIAHGQMPEEKLERVMVKFQKGESNVLVCTTIIESGLDMPNVNTLIVNRADRFGLTQLYQLRGRIGRGSNLAYAYFLYDKDKHLTGTAEKRLRTIFEASELGAGFSLAMKDLEIRGAGTLLGTRQSGNISAVGFNLYTQLLSQSVEEQKALKAGIKKEIKPIQHPESSIDLPLKAYIPEEYIPDVDMRLSIYQRLTGLTTVEQVDDIARELNDRFGFLPVEVQNLLYVVKLKAIATKAGIETISTNGDIITIRLLSGLQTNRQKLVHFYRYNVKIGITQVIINLKRLGKDWQKILQEIVQATG
jgi:transcription-repair coupling factor (superfamily II helicase)